MPFCPAPPLTPPPVFYRGGVPSFSRVGDGGVSAFLAGSLHPFAQLPCLPRHFAATDNAEAVGL
jgi:hypothetical protein